MTKAFVQTNLCEDTYKVLDYYRFSENEDYSCY